MLRYFTVIWDDRDAIASEQAKLTIQRIKDRLGPWDHAIQRPGMHVYSRSLRRADGDALLLPGSSGVILGTLFENGVQASTRRRSALQAEAGIRAINTRGRSLLEEFWGSYVLLLHQAATRTAFVLRSPMGGLPAFHAKYMGVHLCFSSVEDCVELGLLRFSINWGCIRAQAANGDYLTHRTALNEIATTECGECVELRNSELIRHSYWSPCSVARSTVIDDFSVAAERLQATTQLSINGWAEGHDAIVHTLSGGLDSSIVLACLIRTPTKPRVTCTTSYSQHAVGDEREFARSMAQLAGVELVERERDARLDVSVVLGCPLTTTPILSFTALDNYPAEVSLARREGATAIFNGELGDNVFGSTLGHEAVAEHVSRHGLRRGLIGVAEDSARLRQSTVWKALYDGIRSGLFQSRASYWSAYIDGKRLLQSDAGNQGLIADEALEEYERTIEEFIHPWFRDIRDVPLGKFQLIYALYTITSATYHPPLADRDDPLIVTPLASQPLVDVALSISTELNIRGGHDRSVARHAFASHLSDLVLNRRGKGHPGFWVRDLIAKNRAVFREILCDGILVKERILDRRKIEATLSGDVTKSNISIYDTIVQLYIEAWLRRWRASGSLAA